MLWLLFNFFEPRIYKFSNLLYTLGMIMGFISYYYIYLLFFFGVGNFYNNHCLITPQFFLLISHIWGFNVCF